MKIFLAIVFIAFSFTAFSQNDDKAIRVLDQLSEKIDSYKTLHIQFNVIVENTQEGSTDTMPGILYYKDDKYRLEFVDQIVFSHGNTTYSYLKDVEEINITESEELEEPDIFDPKSLLKNYKSNYKCRFISDRFVRNRPLVEIDLIPIDIEDKSYSRISLLIDKSKIELFSVLYLGKDGTGFLVEFLSFKINTEIPDSLVIFNENDYPNADIIDMR
ncbi:MAG TPA: outer membrane lipoprotein carrier protein LolA [Bacteroidales bacterium]|jgi:outer membrane lipoprotein-sorting protein|nr:outer membrane lipoprotein carrier protein LolA [Bacteroidales bacterium]MDD4236601.1 outer membrane lipoprotein carrier protein LolA [Bacteroidales bacterium]HXK82599.1 outer membrane lipoprotein carrier protein LolA [Bacteroidales bacterium]